MRKTYQVLAYLIVALVVVQVAAIAWAVFGVNEWVSNDNGVINKQLLECEGDCEMNFFAEWGFAIHMFFNGTILIPLISLILLIVSFFAKVPGGVARAAIIIGLIVLQVLVLPLLSDQIDPIFGALHGINALILMGVAADAGRRAGVIAKTEPGPSPVAA